MQQTFMVPTAAMRAGDFSEVAAAYPASGSTTPSRAAPGGVGRDAVPEQQHPERHAEPDRAEDPRRPGRCPTPRPTSTATASPTTSCRAITVKNDRDNFDVKLTWQRTPSHSIWAKFGMLDAEVIDNFILGFDQGSLGDTRVYVGTIGHTWTLSPSWCSTATSASTAGAVGDRPRLRHELGPDASASPAPTAATRPLQRAALEASGATATTFGTTPNWMPLFRNEQSYTFSSALTKVHDQARAALRHRRREARAQPLPGRVRQHGGVRGAASPSATTTSPRRRATSRSSWNQFGGFLLGLQSIQAKDVQEIQMTGREWQMAAFIRDRWQVGQKLTLSLGLRFEYYPLMTRADSGHRAAGLQHLRGLLGGYGNDAARTWASTSSRLPGSAPRCHVPAHREDGAPRRATAGPSIPLPWSRPMRGSYPYDISYNQTAEQYGWLGTLERRHPAGPGARSQQRPRSSCRSNTFMRSPNPTDVDRAVLQQANVAVEHRLPRRHRDRGGLRARALGRRLCRPQRQLRRARRRTGGAPVFSVAGTSDIRTGRAAPSAATTRCRWRSTVRSRTACC